MNRSLIGKIAVGVVYFLISLALVRTSTYRLEADPSTATPAPAADSGASSAPAPAAAPGDVFVGPKLPPGFAMGVNSSGGKTDWVTIEPSGVMDCTYPAGQTWGAVFVTAGPLEAVVDRRKTKDLS